MIGTRLGPYEILAKVGEGGPASARKSATRASFGGQVGPFLVMELVEGPTLEELIAGSWLSALGSRLWALARPSVIADQARSL